MAFNHKTGKYDPGSFPVGSTLVTAAGVTRRVTGITGEGVHESLTLDGGPMGGGEYLWTVMVPKQDADKLWYEREPFASRTGSGQVLSRVEQELRGIPQPSGWIGDRPTYDADAVRRAIAEGYPLPRWAIMGNAVTVSTVGATGTTGIVVEEVKPAPAPPIPPPPPPPPPVPPPAQAAPGFVNLTGVAPNQPAPPPAPAPGAPPSAPAGEVPIGVGIAALLGALLVLG